MDLKNGINVLSLFDGISCGQLALGRAEINVNKYYASEIKESSIKCTMGNFPDTIQLGDVTKLDISTLPKIDLLIGGSPCQDLSIANVINKGNQEGLNGTKSSLFYEYVRILKQLRPTYFLLENVSNMKEHDRSIISSILGVEPIKINSNLVSYQNRSRYYWTNIPNITQPVDRNINFQNYICKDHEKCKEFKVNRTPSREKMWGNGINGNCKNVTNETKINCITCRQDRWKNAGLVEFEDFCRYLTTTELEIGQTLPVGYTRMLNKHQAANVIGDGWTVDVIAHIFSFLPQEYKEVSNESDKDINN